MSQQLHLYCQCRQLCRCYALTLKRHLSIYGNLIVSAMVILVVAMTRDGRQSTAASLT